MQEALRVVREEGKSVYSVAKDFNLARSTLNDRVLEKHEDQPGRPTKLSSEDEKALVNYSIYMAEKGFPLTAGVIKALAKAVDKESCKKRGEEPRFGGKLPGSKWWRCFRRRHPEISMRCPDKLDRARAAMSNSSIIGHHFKTLGDLMTKEKLHQRPYLIYNADETGMSLDAKKSRVIVPTSSKRAPSVSSGGRDHITVMACVSAAGTVIPPMIIFSKSRPSGNFSEGGPPGAVYTYSESGFINTCLFEEWFLNTFMRHCHRERPVLLVLDQHTSHISLKVLTTAMRENIILYGLPPHTSQYSQPLDVTVFSTLKAQWATTLETLQAADTKFLAKKRNFPSIFSTVQDSSFTPNNIKAGFRKAGIYPYNPDAVEGVWKGMSTKSEETAHSERNEEDKECSENASTSQPSEPTVISTTEKVDSTPACCVTCGHATVNPILETLVPKRLQGILRPLENTTTPQTKRKKLTARVMTHQDIIDELKKKEEDEKLKKANAEERKKKAMLNRMQKEVKAKEVVERRKEREERKREMEANKAKAVAERRKEREERKREMEANKQAGGKRKEKRMKANAGKRPEKASFNCMHTETRTDVVRRKERKGRKMTADTVEQNDDQNRDQGDVVPAESKRRRLKKKLDCYEYDY
ncbi:JRKL [Branchiostoma lanceolatum]|uniref:JRKL protein n=1 Tax=Branchiostoma lanceolatum TaxID=7740 RepID=A0A8S4MM85_BRALA|nr:JRKL [Branchiostoma lanceolatum]